MRFVRKSRLARYLVSAGTVAALYLTVYWGGLELGLHYLLAILVAHVAAVGAAFPLYRNFVFASVGPFGSDLARFLGTWISGAVAGVIATPILVELFNVQAFWAHLIGVIAVGALTYVAHRVFTFRPRRVANLKGSGDDLRVAI